MPGQPVNVGASVSLGATSKRHVAELPAASTAVNVTIVVAVITVPAAGDWVIVIPEPKVQLSVAVTDKLEMKFGSVYVQAGPKDTAWLLGQLTKAGGVVSTRFTLKLHDALFPLASVTVNVTTVVPTPDTAAPAAGDCVTVNEPVAVQLSATVANER